MTLPSETTRCPICTEAAQRVFTTTVLGRHAASYHYCNACGFLHVPDPSWLDEAYSSAIASTDTGLVTRNLDIARKLAAVFHGLLGERGEGRYVDVAGGYGMLTRLMRDYGFDYRWADRYCENLLARGFEFKPPAEGSKPATAVTAIEIMEHLEDPLGFVEESLANTRAGCFIFTTELFENAPPPQDWWYYSFETGQHIAFFQHRTLVHMARRLNMHFASANGLHVFSRTPVSPQALKLHTGRLSHLGLLRARRALASRTLADHAAMRDRLRGRAAATASPA